jgi:hypothetical protein
MNFENVASSISAGHLLIRHKFERPMRTNSNRKERKVHAKQREEFFALLCG